MKEEVLTALELGFSVNVLMERRRLKVRFWRCSFVGDQI
jgi:hypothetical protein